MTNENYENNGVPQNSPTGKVAEAKKKLSLPIIAISIAVVAAIIAGIIFLPGILNKDDENSCAQEESTEAAGSNKVWLVAAEASEDAEGNKEKIVCKYDANGNTVEEAHYSK